MRNIKTHRTQTTEEQHRREKKITAQFKRNKHRSVRKSKYSV